MKHTGLGPNTMKPAREFLVNQGKLLATRLDNKGQNWEFEILNPETFQPFTSDWATDDPATVNTGWGTFTFADHFDEKEFDAE